MRIDLHLHSTASDGMLAPAEVVRTARAAGLDIVALTDHDTAVGVPEALEAAGGELVVVPGIEISSTHAGAELHVLGYFVDPLDPALVAHGEAAVTRRRERMHGMIDRLAGLGVAIDYEDVLRAAGPDAAALGRPHLARVLVEGGHVPNFAEAFNRYLADGGPAYLPTELLTPREAIELIHAAGGLAVWAHPPLATLEREIGHFVAWGLDGIECWRPRNSPSEVARLLSPVRRLGLLPTGGSDWHGGWHGDMGSFYVTRREVGEILERGGV